MAKAVKSDEKMKDEEALAALDGVVRQLESGDGSLEELIKLYERGMELVKLCNAQLDKYETKIKKLADVEENAHDDT